MIKSLFSFRHLRTQLIVYFMIISLAGMAGASYYIYSFMQNMIKEQNERLLYQQFQQLDHNIGALISEVDRLSMLFLRDDRIQQLLYGISEKTELELLEAKNDVQNNIEDIIGNYGYIDSIYITADNLGAVGGNENTTLVYAKEDWEKTFFSSEPFRRSIEEYPKMIVQGGLKKSFYNPYMTDAKDGNLISMMRRTRAIYDPRTSATLIFNIDERYLASIYATALGEDEGDMYIVDGSGTVISSSRPERVGSASAFMPAEQEPGSYGSRVGSQNSQELQIVYYKLNDAGWYMMKEIPLYQYSDQIFSVQRMLVLVFMISLVFIFIVSYFWLRKIIKPLHLLSGKMKEMSRGELGITFDRIPQNELGTVIRRFNEMSLSMVELIDKNNEIQEKKRELEIEALQYQINPHFLYNTLNMIRWMASLIKADNIVKTIVALGNILRPVFSSKDPMCSLSDELSYLENYIKIINMRFNNSIHFEIGVDEALLDCRVPRFILQPLVENSIASGRQQEEHAIRIAIRAAEADGTLRLIVTDSGEGIEPDRMEELNARLATGESFGPSGEGSGIGLNNVNKRIRLYFGPAYGIRFVPVAKGAEVEVSLPAVRPSSG
jgi:Predicted signal transduction protein with a C-terminal ATPase domain